MIKGGKVKIKIFEIMTQGGDIACEERRGRAIFCEEFKEGKDGVHMDQRELEPGEKG